MSESRGNPCRSRVHLFVSTTRELPPFYLLPSSREAETVTRATLLPIPFRCFSDPRIHLCTIRAQRDYRLCRTALPPPLSSNRQYHGLGTRLARHFFRPSAPPTNPDFAGTGPGTSSRAQSRDHSTLRPGRILSLTFLLPAVSQLPL